MTLSKWLASVLIAWHGFNLLIDGLPSVSAFQDRLRGSLSGYRAVTGQWQGTLAFFAPKPDTTNLHLEARLEYADGFTSRWRSPDWQTLGILDRFLTCRMIKYVDNVRRDDRRAAWEGLARYVRRTEALPDRELSRIVLSRHWDDIRAPSSDAFQPRIFPVHAKSFDFFTRDYP